MTRTNKEIIAEIHTLLEELSTTEGARKNIKIDSSKEITTRGVFSGCMGGLLFLQKDAYFDQPRSRQEVIKKLEDIGRFYKPESVSMNLMNLSKKSGSLTRLGSKGSYKFVIKR